MVFAFKMKLLPELFVFLLCVTSLGLCAPTSWQVNQLAVHEGLVQREERDVSEGSGEGSGTGPCSDDEDSPCLVTEYAEEYPKPHVESLDVETSITARYVSTTVVTVMRNRAPIAQDSNFRFRLTKDAFISDFFMVVEGEKYQAEVQEKEVAQKAYNEARQRGQTAGQIKQSENDFTKFETNVNLSPQTTVSFHLTYQELLRRENGVFQHKINLFPKEIVRHLRADVHITEPQGISFANITWEQDESLTTDFLYDALSVEYKSDQRVHAVFHPSAVNQEGLSETGLQGDLVVTYDVVHDSGPGHIEIVNGYFVHHISPVGIPVTRKDVVFVIDVSGSMNLADGTSESKISQTKLAMSTIIDEIRDFDRFNIICFSSSIRTWQPNLVEASEENKIEAKLFVESLHADGYTDLYQGVIEAIDMLQILDTAGPMEAFSMIILLTDGEPTVGVTNGVEIVQGVTEATQEKIALFSLAFGRGADYGLLEKLSGNNNGLARKIYHDSNPSLQLEGFYKEVATPLLFNIEVKYDENVIEKESLTDTNFISYFEGTELVIAGKLKENCTMNEVSAVVSGNSFDFQVEWGLTKQIPTESDSSVDSVLKGHVVDDFAQRLWAYATIKDLLAKSRVTIDSEEKTALTDRALSLALKYKFVTPLTSLIVIKPDDEQNVNDVLTEEVQGDDQPSAPALSVWHRPGYPLAPSRVSYMMQVGRGPSPPVSAMMQVGRGPSPPVSAMMQVGRGPSPPVSAMMQVGRGPSPPVSAMMQGAPILAPTINVPVTVTPVPPIYVQVDGDPHFSISFPGQNASLCFNAHGNDGSTVNLISDSKSGIALNAQFTSFDGSSAAKRVKSSSYFTTVSVVLGEKQLLVTPEKIALHGMNIDWTTSTNMMFIGFGIQVYPKEKLLTIRSTEDITFHIRRHQDERPWMRNKVNHLGIYVENSSGFSDAVDGLLGQFYRNKLSIYETGTNRTESESGKTANLNFSGQIIPLVWHPKQTKNCWHVKNKSQSFIDPSNFEVESLFSSVKNN